MSWKQFKKLRTDVQADYINGLIEKFNANAVSLSEMFGTSAFPVRNLQNKLKGVTFKRGLFMNQAERDAWEAFINPPTPNDNSVNDIKEVESPKPAKMQMINFSLSFSGTINVMVMAAKISWVSGFGRMKVPSFGREC